MKRRSLLKKMRCLLAGFLALTILSTSAFAYSRFDLIMDIAQAYGLDLEESDILRNYFDKLLQEHPEYFNQLVNDILQAQDSHSMYLSAEDYSQGFDLTASSYVGIGISFKKKAAGYTIESVFEDGPADLAGLKAGDVIVAVDDTAVGPLDSDSVVKKLMGAQGTSIWVTVRRNGQEKTYLMSRKAVTKSNVQSETVAEGVEYIKINGMGYEEDIEKFNKIWDGLAAKKTAAVILDLRGNSGGLISMALDMLNKMIPDEGIKYMSIRNREDMGGLTKYYSEGLGLDLNKIIVLVDGETASAAEMVAGSLSDLKYATMLGEKTYGKGVGQVHIGLTDGSYVVVTTLQMLLPVREGYEGTGLVPDLQISNKNGTDSMAYLTAMATNKTLYYGQSSKSIQGLNQRLIALGYQTYDLDYYSTKTQQAVRQFQRDHGLPIKDSCDSATLKTLESVINEMRNSVIVNDQQLDTAIVMCKNAAKQPLKYTVNEDGTWKNNSKDD